MSKTTKSKLPWFLYWLSCIVGGIVLGLVLGYFTTQPQVELDVPQGRSPTPAPSIADTSDSPTTLLFTGDVMLGRSVGYNIARHHDPSWPFLHVSSVLREADITYINLENPLVSNCPLTQSGMKFCSDLRNVNGLVEAGIDIASLANNHTTNYGIDGLTETTDTLEKNGIAAVGLDDPITLQRNNTTFTFLSYNDVGVYAGVANVKTHDVAQSVKAAKTEGQVLIVTFHWGAEYVRTPSARQVELAHMAIDAGADLVIGAHPHWVQTSETYLGKPIYYSLGNFVFDQEWSSETKRGLAVRFTYDGTNLVKVDELPVSIRDYGQAYFE